MCGLTLNCFKDLQSLGLGFLEDATQLSEICMVSRCTFEGDMSRETPKTEPLVFLVRQIFWPLWV